MKWIVCTLLICLLGSGSAWAQNDKGEVDSKRGKVKILGPIENVTITKIDGKRARIMVGNVAFQKDSVIFKCDSAIQFFDDEVTYAYRNVRFNQGDSLKLNGDEMVFDDKKELAIISGKRVTMTDGKMNLETTRLYYDMASNIGYYIDSAYIKDSENRLWSQKGYYYANTRNMYFKERVRLINNDYDVTTDTLQYHVTTENAFFFGPTTMKSKEGEVLYCERGNFYTKRNEARLGKNSRIETEGQILSGDSITYNSNTGKGRAFKRVKLLDTAQRLAIEGNTGWYDKKDDAFMITDSVLFSQFQDDDTLHLTSDTLRMFYDSTRVNRISIAYHHVRIFSGTYQADCDSMYYHSGDSVMHFSGDPIFWMEDFQVKADFISARLKDDELHHVHLQDAAVMGRRHDDSHFDQIGADSMDAYFKEGKLRKIKAFGDPRAVYYALDEDSAYMGVNKTGAVVATIQFKDGKITRLNFAQNARANMMPPQNVDPKTMILPGFVWKGLLRPTSLLDIFTSPEPELPEVENEENSTSEGEKEETKKAALDSSTN